MERREEGKIQVCQYTASDDEFVPQATMNYNIFPTIRRPRSGSRVAWRGPEFDGYLDTNILMMWSVEVQLGVLGIVREVTDGLPIAPHLFPLPR